MSNAPLVLTVELEPQAQKWAQDLRTAHFPPARNIVPAHVTLFHALPFDSAPQVLDHIVTNRPAPGVRIEAPFSLGGGVAFRLSCPEIAVIRSGIAALFPSASLKPQDRAPWRPHLTVQNKVSAETASTLLATLRSAPRPEESHAAALRLWRYENGPWHPLARLAFDPPVPA
ncbi:2'-5' RNA ligase family protein [Swaminathania salitolerans]|uniref:2'-5' RNA ligase family protein n=1 Tax=Swaminathania salitolerans TaxID=182838 RepID=A0A511BLR9_9PROT|nr:2'-5' RNA ligase family protein [Swaminathania salitolerans]GBQ10175.1 hypothetical protein AA21291_0336 [Swaminathania salitolerans LMG 21291]GEL01195.1 hypothetical protein SSA02_03580 [Swaminathania salitolerans]